MKILNLQAHLYDNTKSIWQLTHHSSADVGREVQDVDVLVLPVGRLVLQDGQQVVDDGLAGVARRACEDFG